MAKFAKYWLRYDYDFSPHSWEDRQQHLADLFKDSDSIVFGEGEPSEEQKKEGIPYAKVFNHRIYHLRCNPNIIIMQLANNIDIPMETNFEAVVAKNEPSLFAIIDNREGMRTIAIQNRRKAFSAPRRVAQIIAERVNDRLYHEYCYRLEILPEYYPADLFQAWKEQQECAQNLRFPCTTELSEEEIMKRVDDLKKQGKDYFADSLMPMLLEMRMQAKKAKYDMKLAVMPDCKNTAMFVDKTTMYMKNLITFASAIGEPVEIVTKEGAVFRCFVEPEEENTDKIVHCNLDESLLNLLFKGRKNNYEVAEPEDVDKAENAVVEMLNGMKHTSEDIERKVDVA